MQYDDGRCAKHPRFRFFAINTEMRHRVLVYIRQHPEDGQLSMDELQDMVGRQGEAFSSRVLHYASSLRGTNQCWQHQRSGLLSMVDTLGLPTVFFTHSAADLQWPELAHLICPDNPDSRTARAKAVIENPALADWFFYHRVIQFVKAFYTGVLGATDYWLRFEWQHQGSPHVHGLAWLPDTPDVEQLRDGGSETSETLKEDIIRHADQLISTVNPAVLPDGSNISGVSSISTLSLPAENDNDSFWNGVKFSVKMCQGDSFENVCTFALCYNSARSTKLWYRMDIGGKPQTLGPIFMCKQVAFASNGWKIGTGIVCAMARVAQSNTTKFISKCLLIVVCQEVPLILQVFYQLTGNRPCSST